MPPHAYISSLFAFQSMVMGLLLLCGVPSLYAQSLPLNGLQEEQLLLRELSGRDSTQTAQSMVQRPWSALDYENAFEME
ncbi:MAG: hypothetical protein ACQER4_09700, partial [Bacteroidota bacterium]